MICVVFSFLCALLCFALIIKRFSIFVYLFDLEKNFNFLYLCAHSLQKLICFDVLRDQSDMFVLVLFALF